MPVMPQVLWRKKVKGAIS